LSRNYLKSTDDFSWFELKEIQFLGLFGNYIDCEGEFDVLSSYFTSQLTTIAMACPKISDLGFEGNPLAEKLIEFEV